MGFPLLATVVWLAWVFGRQTSIDAMAMLLALLLATGLSAWVLGRWMLLHHKGHVRLTAALIALVIFVPTLAWVVSGVRKMPTALRPAVLAPAGSIAWQPFSASAVEALRAEGRAVFIDFTADWCITCKVNERAALSKPEVARAFAEKNVAALKADWTHADEAITKALEGYGRNSIPLYVYYPAGGEGYRILPQVLTPKGVIESL